jgi:putative two-component system response regulator
MRQPDSPRRVLIVGPPGVATPVDEFFQDESWQCEHLHSTGGVLRRLREQGDVDLVLLVVNGDMQQQLELCRQIKLDLRTASVPVIFISSADSDARLTALESGADDCLDLQMPMREIALRIGRTVRIKEAMDSLEDARAVVIALANAIEGRDPYTGGHVERVSAYCLELGRRLGLGPEALGILRTGGIVHDIGKIAVPDAILNKPGKLTDFEMEIIKRHPVVGYDLLKPFRTFEHVLPLVRWHHERPNGKGYPDGLEGDELPLMPRIVAVADAFDALSTARPYRQALPVARCREILVSGAQNGDFAPEVVEVFGEMLDGYAAPLAPAGTV